MNKIIVAVLVCVIVSGTSVFAQQLYVGTATADISPKLPVALMGQFFLRVAHTAETPLVASVVAIESRNGDQSDYVIFVGCDVVVIPPDVLSQARKSIAERIPELDVYKVILTATHTHTAPVMDSILLKYPIPRTGVTQIGEYNDFFVSRITDAVEKAWKNRAAGSMSYGLGYAVVGRNRRSTYSDGRSLMYGTYSHPDYRGPEGPENHEVNSFFFWNNKGKLIATCIATGSPAQEVEGDSTVSADFWHEARLQLRKKLGQDVTILGWVSSAGDMAPRLMYNYAAENRMHRLRNTSRLQELGRRITNAVMDTYEVVRNDKQSKVPVLHQMDTLQLPMRMIGIDEYADGRRKVDMLTAEIKADPSKNNELAAQRQWYQDGIDRFHEQYKKPTFPSEIHAIRIGDAVVATNPFEMFHDFGLRIVGRSKAVQTVNVQLAGAGNYLTTEKAVKGGGYSVIMQSSKVGPEGGTILVDRMVEMINGMWPDNKK